MIFWETSMHPKRVLHRTAFNSRMLAPAAIGIAALVLGGCTQSRARQDTYKVANSTCSYMMPTVSGTRTYAPAKPSTSSEAEPKSAPDSQIAYPNPETPAFCDRPLSDTLPSSLEMADYTHLLNATGLLAILQQDGPFTVFGIPNSALETYDAQTGNKLTSPDNKAVIKEMLSYTIVKGRWPLAKIKQAALASPTQSVGLPTLNGQLLSAWVDGQSGQVVIGNGQGMVSHLWVTGIPQSNGVLYFIQDLVLPPIAQQNAGTSTPVSAAPSVSPVPPVSKAQAQASTVAARTQPATATYTSRKGNLTTPPVLQLP
ncbi:fasciclin [Acetobacter ascendens]|uniref:Fasciclin n=1 Tax=Acetobacter ascendens TaxID=481146 RepID=A0A1D8QY40_9PROT|nr:fasciclin domain-containing protein [Acetobacter ascendens]AOW47246.1 fasciclin [Acetobacter ascendens]